MLERRERDGEILERYFWNICSVQKFSDFASLSRLLVEAYDYVLVEINEVKFLAIAPVYEQPTIPTLVNHMKKISSEKFTCRLSSEKLNIF